MAKKSKTNGTNGSRRAVVRDLPISRLIPNMVTLAGICIGLSAIRFALAERWEMAVAAIIAAAVMDGMDGRLARLLKSTSPFGAQLDSLADIINFGVVPAVVLYLWTLEDIGRFGWAAVLFYTVCCAVRLARFNTMMQEEDETSKALSERFFTGVPAPMGASLVMFPLVMHFEWEMYWMHDPFIGAVYMLFMGLLMASRVPTFSIKRLRVRTEWALPLMLGVVLTIVFLTIEAWRTLSMIGIGYFISLPFSMLAYWRAKQTLTVKQ